MNNGEKFKVLLVDDERSNIDALSYILKPKYTVFVAKDGLTAIEVAEKTDPDLILLDVVMPGMSGFDTLAKLKNSDLTRKIPVIFITGRDSVEDEERGFALGAVDYITKPFHNSIVEARVRTHLQMREYTRMIEHLCMIDAITNIPNRRYFDKQSGIEWARAAREQTPISVLMLDVDRFKEYNDANGHPHGDAMLRAVASVLEQMLNRPADFAARWGGDEFVVMLPDTNLNGALEVAERIRVSIENTVVPCPDGTDTKMTVSIGVNTEDPVKNGSVENFISGADKALYAAKEDGRNKVVHFVKLMP